MELSPQTINLIIILVSVIGSNAVSVAVIKQLLKAMDRRIDKNEGNIDKLFEDTKYVMTGNEIRRILHEQVDPVSSKVDDIHDDVITMKARMRTRWDDAQSQH